MERYKKDLKKIPNQIRKSGFLALDERIKSVGLKKERKINNKTRVKTFRISSSSQFWMYSALIRNLSESSFFLVKM